MKLILNVLTISCLYIATVWGQASHIGFLLAGNTIHFNMNITVQIVRPNSIQGSTKVGITIGLLSCPASQEANCPLPAGQLGSVLYAGPFTPTVHPMAHIYENFMLTVPSAGFLATRRAQLAVVRNNIFSIFIIGILIQDLHVKESFWPAVKVSPQSTGFGRKNLVQ
ncbi:hypothetical protein DFH08DRAFT_783787 [Mycena albidolilacea]|uniref:Uncharacterized protein n=1 Tax=Mycena albidolilacea TaxID=1033008 RepID=A0AAD7ELJ6_9AGAR|nr:hypothetical protein DFH08DRAFT_783787 [Mycena albidolilacea]